MENEQENDLTPPTEGRRRVVYLSVGYGALGLAAAGAVLPLLPATPFLLVAAWGFGKSSPRLRRALDAHPRFGPMLRDWREHRAIPRRAKVAAYGSLAGSWAILWTVTATPTVPLLAAVPMSIVTVFIASRPSAAPATRPPVSEPAAGSER